ncbi:MAG: hypothetical protein IJ651_06960, partial [Bacteroidales bacterium]|nr:hypothetical protein [Bacteroidales bacterium]
CDDDIPVTDSLFPGRRTSGDTYGRQKAKRKKQSRTIHINSIYLTVKIINRKKTTSRAAYFYSKNGWK